MLHDLLNYVAFVKTVIFVKLCYYCSYAKFNEGLSSDSNAAAKKLFLEVKNRQKCEKNMFFCRKGAKSAKRKGKRRKIKD